MEEIQNVKRDLTSLYRDMALEVLTEIKDNDLSIKAIATDLNMTDDEFIDYMVLKKTNYGVYSAALDAIKHEKETK